MPCPHCGETLGGDGFTFVLHCPNARLNDYWFSTPDDEPVFCEPDECLDPCCSDPGCPNYYATNPEQ